MTRANGTAIDMDFDRSGVWGPDTRDVKPDAEARRALQPVQARDGTTELQLVEPKSDRSCRIGSIPPSIVPMLVRHRAQQNRERLVASSRWRTTGVHGEHPKVVQEMLGHSSVQLTLDTYSHLLPDLQLKERAAARLDGILTGAGQNPDQNDQEVVTLTFASWNQVTGWLRQLDKLRRPV